MTRAFYKEAGVTQKARSLYVRRHLKNADEFIAWAKGEGFPTVYLPEDLHVTVAYSKKPVEWPEAPDDKGFKLSRKDGRAIELFGEDEGTAVLRFKSDILTKRWQELCDAGCSWDHEEYNPHVSISMEVPEDLDISKVEPFEGDLVFGPEEFDEIDDSWSDDHTEKVASPMAVEQKALTFTQVMEKVGARHTRKEYEDIQACHDAAVRLGATCDHDNAEKRADTSKSLPEFQSCTFIKVDKKLGIVFGWAIISKEGDEDYYDTQGDHIPEDAMLEAAVDFMQSRRHMKIMHAGVRKGTVVFAFPLTTEIADAMEIKTERTGLMIGIKPDSSKVVDLFDSGEYTGFSIGGTRIVDEELEDE